MLRRLTFFLMVFAVLLGGSGLPALAHVHDGLVGHALEIVEENAKEADGDQGSQKTPRDMVGHAGHHHHGTDALKITALDDLPGLAPSGTLRFMAATMMLKSLNSAPPTQPPSA
ncbi:hypothetical protein [Novosphingobium lentum]|uniref:hypothetical protein n=1 Tax=Novosphingobium lentum TaxID=145287 RepID=UPI0012ED038B|nr:hypothetical protein [Novosphingobium lentum]